MSRLCAALLGVLLPLFTAIGWTSHTYDITFSAGDSIELWAWWQSTQGRVRNFVLTNTFNENFFVVTKDI